MYRYNPAPIRYGSDPASQIYSTFHGEIRGEREHIGSEDEVRASHGDSGCSQRLGTCTMHI